uniref:Uncharacterized protein n=1 Tax=Anguilla anguilla TaxID=7936 RepID=A0A0E9VTG6_ANGAN
MEAGFTNLEENYKDVTQVNESELNRREVKMVTTALTLKLGQQINTLTTVLRMKPLCFGLLFHQPAF